VQTRKIGTLERPGRRLGYNNFGSPTTPAQKGLRIGRSL